MIKNNKTPLYLQIMGDLIEKIDQKEYKENQKLPSERGLCDMYQVSRITIRQALQGLEREGYIHKSHGRGTFVSPKVYSQSLVKLYSFTEEMKKLGKEPTTKVLSFDVIPAGDRLAGKMNLERSEDVFQVVRLRLADGEPLMYERSYIPKKIFPDLTAEALAQKPMYSIFQEDYNVVVTKALERFTATSVDGEEAHHLRMMEYEPAINIIRSAYYHDVLIEYTISVARGDKFEYTVELT